MRVLFDFEFFFSNGCGYSCSRFQLGIVEGHQGIHYQVHIHMKTPPLYITIYTAVFTVHSTHTTTYTCDTVAHLLYVRVTSVFYHNPCLLDVFPSSFRRNSVTHLSWVSKFSSRPPSSLAYGMKQMSLTLPGNGVCYRVHYN